MTSNQRRECRHETLHFGSGDYYIFCANSECGARWVCCGTGSDLPDAHLSNQGVGGQLSGQERSAVETPALRIQCDRCHQYLSEPGALLFGPPVNGQCAKWHLCVRCCTHPSATEFLQAATEMLGGRRCIHLMLPGECPTCSTPKVSALPLVCGKPTEDGLRVCQNPLGHEGDCDGMPF